MPQSGGSSTTLHRWHRMVRQVLHEHETALSAASPANRSRGLIKCAKESARYRMDLEASGYENIIMRAILLGMSYQQARGLAPEVEQFTELGEYLDLPVRTYSTGMMLRLAFAVATSIEPEILIMDEVIAVGDASFMEKATQRINTLIAKANIFVLASHDEGTLKRFCNRAIWLNRGELAADGPLDCVLAAYNKALS